MVTHPLKVNLDLTFGCYPMGPVSIPHGLETIGPGLRETMASCWGAPSNLCSTIDPSNIMFVQQTLNVTHLSGPWSQDWSQGLETVETMDSDNIWYYTTP